MGRIEMFFLWVLLAVLLNSFFDLFFDSFCLFFIRLQFLCFCFFWFVFVFQPAALRARSGVFFDCQDLTPTGPTCQSAQLHQVSNCAASAPYGLAGAESDPVGVPAVPVPALG